MNLEATREGQEVSEWLTANKVGRMLGVSGLTVRNWAVAGKLPGYRFADVWRFKRAEIEAYLESSRNIAIE